MKNNEANIFVFIASIIIGILIAMNVSLKTTQKKAFLSASQYQDAYNKKNNLLNDINYLRNEYKKYDKKLQKYKSNRENEKQVIEEIKNELNINKFVMGNVEVHGPGIKIILKDSDKDFQDPVKRYFSIVHNTDIIQVINDLKVCGAEAISLNGQRIIDRSEVYCHGPFLRVNGIKIASPFYINAIGNKEAMKKYMLLNENYLKSMMSEFRNINVKIEESDDVKIPTYVNKINHDYLKLN